MINEDQVEQLAIQWFQELGYDYLYGPDIAHDGINPLRADYHSVLIESRLNSALTHLNPDAPASAITEAIAKLKNPQKASLIQNNLSFHHMLTQGIGLEVKTEEGWQGERIKLIDFHHPENNDFLIVNQFTLKGSKMNRRPDIVVFINGIPIFVIELKTLQMSQPIFSRLIMTCKPTNTKLKIYSFSMRHASSVMELMPELVP